MGFIRKVENFRCEVCGVMVEGNGYTDHCPKCLWGKHQDGDMPGDRASECGGLMEPVGAQTKGVGYKLSYKCVVCGKKFDVESAENDNREEIIKISAGINRG
jgi:hypothetical protein